MTFISRTVSISWTCNINIMSADDLATEGARASAVMIMTNTDKPSSMLKGVTHPNSLGDVVSYLSFHFKLIQELKYKKYINKLLIIVSKINSLKKKKINLNLFSSQLTHWPLGDVNDILKEYSNHTGCWFESKICHLKKKLFHKFQISEIERGMNWVTISGNLHVNKFQLSAWFNQNVINKTWFHSKPN